MRYSTALFFLKLMYSVKSLKKLKEKKQKQSREQQVPVDES